MHPMTVSTNGELDKTVKKQGAASVDFDAADEGCVSDIKVDWANDDADAGKVRRKAARPACMQRWHHCLQNRLAGTWFVGLIWSGSLARHLGTPQPRIIFPTRPRRPQGRRGLCVGRHR